MTIKRTEKRENSKSEGKEVTGMSGSGYIGKIKNSGTQMVKAPNQVKPGTGKSTIKTGTDLRSGKK